MTVLYNNHFLEEIGLIGTIFRFFWKCLLIKGLLIGVATVFRFLELISNFFNKSIFCYISTPFCYFSTHVTFQHRLLLHFNTGYISTWSIVAFQHRLHFNIVNVTFQHTVTFQHRCWNATVCWNGLCWNVTCVEI